MANELCGACPTNLRPGNRRDLGSCAAVASTLAALISEQYPQQTADSLNGKKRFLCRSCYRSIERLLKLRAEVESLETTIKEKLRKRSELETRSGERTPPRRRRRSDGAGTSHSPTKRKCVDTPTRHAIQSLQPAGDSPLVAVSLTQKISYVTM